ncbi:MAG: hypothetical protein MUC49_06205 [Raineya sp.]|jgi:hypothetical protein|nr:hypothetical protein [Raineya sp.]
MKTFLYLSFLITIPILAQKPLKPSKFRVLVEQGELYQFQKSSFSKTKQEKVLAGSPIYKKSIIVLKPNDYLILADTSGYMLEFSQEKNIDIDSLEQHYKPQERTWGKKYNPYILTNLINASKIEINKNHRRYSLGMTTPVSRGGCRCIGGIIDFYSLGNNNNGQDLVMRMFNKDTIALRMYVNYSYHINNKEKFTYTLSFSDFYGRNIHHTNIVATSKYPEAITHINLAPLLEKAKNELIVHGSIAELREPSSQQTTYAFTIITEEERQSILRQDPQIRLTPNTIEDILYLVYFYKRNGFAMDAFRYLEMLIAKRPHVEAFRILYQDFIVENKMRPILANVNHDKNVGTWYYQTINPTEDDYIKSKYFKTRP